MRRIHGNSPRGSSNGKVTGVGHETPVSLLQPSATSRTSSNGRPAMRLGYERATRHVEERRGVGSVRQDLQWSDDELGRRLGFQYLRIKIHRRMGTIYRAFCTES
jgi:hypothetical protein